jgi:hypothetical protein
LDRAEKTAAVMPFLTSRREPVAVAHFGNVGRTIKLVIEAAEWSVEVSALHSR